jgi:large subunit ribosomal protein L24e
MAKKNPRKVRWTKAYRELRGKDMTVVSWERESVVWRGAGSVIWCELQDATFEFEKRRNVPVRYDRNLVSATVKAMKRIDEIQAARARRFHEARMRGSEAMEKLQDRQAIAEGIRLVPPKRREEIVREAAAAVSRTESEAAQIEETIKATGITTMASLRKTGAAASASSSSMGVDSSFFPGEDPLAAAIAAAGGTFRSS